MNSCLVWQACSTRPHLSIQRRSGSAVWGACCGSRLAARRSWAALDAALASKAHREACLEFAPFGNHHAELAVGEIDRDLLEGADCIHSEQQGRRLVELELLE